MRSLNDVGARHGGIAFAAAYSASVTASWNSVRADRSRGVRHQRAGGGAVPVPLVRRDPYRIAGAYPLRGLVLLADKPVARRDLEQLPVLMLMPDRPPVRREHDGADVHTVGTFSTFLVVARNPKRSQGCERRYGVSPPFAAG